MTAVECYRPRQTTTTDTGEQNNTGPLSGLATINRYSIIDNVRILISCFANLGQKCVFTLAFVWEGLTF